MAERTIFIPDKHSISSEENYSFTWAPGLSKKQRQKSLASLNEVILNHHPNAKLLDISRYSFDELGAQLSAFNLTIESASGKKMSVECAYHGSKITKEYGHLTDIYTKTSMEAKKDPRHHEGTLLGFKFDDLYFSLSDPRTAFYNYIYITALTQHPDLADQLMNYDIFTDIMFSWKNASACQAQACAIYVALRKASLLEYALASKENFINSVYPFVNK